MPTRPRPFPLPFPKLVSAMLLAFLCATPRLARAEFEQWDWIEVRAPLIRPGFLPRVDLRLWTDYRFNQRNGGLHQAFLRVGPLIHVTRWLLLAIHGTIYSDKVGDLHEQEARFETASAAATATSSASTTTPCTGTGWASSGTRCSSTPTGSASSRRA
jgi:hypothetical protein